jgi:hypothetical protein
MKKFFDDVDFKLFLFFMWVIMLIIISYVKFDLVQFFDHFIFVSVQQNHFTFFSYFNGNIIMFQVFLS